MLPLHCFNVVVQFEFEFFKFGFELNLFEVFCKKKKTFLFSLPLFLLFCFGPAQSLLPFLFSFSSPSAHFRPAQFSSRRPSSSCFRPISAPSSLSSLTPTGRPRLSGLPSFPVGDTDSRSPAALRLAAPCRGPHAKGPSPPLYKRPRPPLNLTPKPPPLASQTLARAAIGARQARVAADLL